MSKIIKPKPQSKIIAPKLKSQVLSEILLADASIPRIAKKYDLSSTTLYGWRIDHKKKLNQNLDSSGSEALEDKFIELLPEEELDKSSLSPSISKSNSKLSEISLMLGNISLSIKGNVETSSLVKILAALEESC
jgi:transposase-like protein